MPRWHPSTSFELLSGNKRCQQHRWCILLLLLPSSSSSPPPPPSLLPSSSSSPPPPPPPFSSSSSSSHPPHLNLLDKAFTHGQASLRSVQEGRDVHRSLLLPVSGEHDRSTHLDSPVAELMLRAAVHEPGGGQARRRALAGTWYPSTCSAAPTPPRASA
eukprot:456982-Hanusia_phi.AAC.1